MANVQVIQRNAHLAGGVRLEMVPGREGKVAKAVLTAISNTRRGPAEAREEEATAIQWTLWGKQAENAAEYLGKGSHVNIVGRLRNNNFERDGETVYSLAFTAEEIDFLGSKADADARSGARRSNAGDGGAATVAATANRARKPRAERQPATGRRLTASQGGAVCVPPHMRPAKVRVSGAHASTRDDCSRPQRDHLRAVA